MEVLNNAVEALNDGKARIKFEKADGTIRDMMCTTNPRMIPYPDNPTEAEGDIPKEKDDNLITNSKSTIETYMWDDSHYTTKKVLDLGVDTAAFTWYSADIASSAIGALLSGAASIPFDYKREKKICYL